MILLLLNVGIVFNVYSGVPLISLKANASFPPKRTINQVSTATVVYQITNQSKKSHTLYFHLPRGGQLISTDGGCHQRQRLLSQQSCQMKIKLDARKMQLLTHGGPFVCMDKSNLMCYQPSMNESLNVKKNSQIAYSVMPRATANGRIFPNYEQGVLSQEELTFQAIPDDGYVVDTWFVDGNIAQKGGLSFTLQSITKNHTVGVSYTQKGILFAGASNGFVYHSDDNGLHWLKTSELNSAINQITSIHDKLIVAINDGHIALSIDNGQHWQYQAIPQGIPLGLFVERLQTHLRIYVSTDNGFIYYSDNEGVDWQVVSKPCQDEAIYSIFLTNDKILYAGCNSGSIHYSSDYGEHWQTIDGPSQASIRALYIANQILYAQTVDGLVNTTTDLQVSGTWVWYAQNVNSLFVSESMHHALAGTQNGFIYSLLTGNDLGFIDDINIRCLTFSADE